MSLLAPIVPCWTTPQSSTRQISIKTQNMIVLTVEFTRILFPGGEKPLKNFQHRLHIPLDARTVLEVTESAGSLERRHDAPTARICSKSDCTPKRNKVRRSARPGTVGIRSVDGKSPGTSFTPSPGANQNPVESLPHRFSARNPAPLPRPASTRSCRLPRPPASASDPLP